MALELKLKTLSLNNQFQLILDNSDFIAYLPSDLVFMAIIEKSMMEKGNAQWFISSLSNNNLCLSNDITQYLLEEQPFGGEE